MAYSEGFSTLIHRTELVGLVAVIRHDFYLVDSWKRQEVTFKGKDLLNNL